MAKLSNKVALITGGTSGIGAATAMLFKAHGADVIVTGNPKSVEVAQTSLLGIQAIVSDASDTAATKRLIEQIKIEHGRIDILFVNAGFGRFAPFNDVDEDFFDSLFNVNVRGAYFILKYAAPIIPNGGSIILTASMLDAIGGSGQSSVYSATKAALRSFGRTFAVELAARNIRVNTISPGPIETPALDALGLHISENSDRLDKIKTQVPLGRLGDAAEVAAAALYLAADATFTTASELFVDGGVVGVG